MTTDTDQLANYDYELPSELIADVPPTNRGDSRLLVVERRAGTIAHHEFAELPELLAPGDRLVFNDSRVLPARLRGVRAATGGKWEGLFLTTTEQGDWKLLGQTRGRLRPGETLAIPNPRRPESPPLHLRLIEPVGEGAWLARPESSAPAFSILKEYGEVPLPPYIRGGRAEPADAERYQTVYARADGSVAAPTAGLHFTEPLIEACRRRGLDASYLTLHVGAGTFRPITAQRLDEHQMHAEFGELTAPVAEEIEQTRRHTGRIVAIGTTSVRLLESAAGSGRVVPFAGETSLFIRPPYEFRAVDALLTNFHLPRSSLLVLVSTFTGRELIRAAYEQAIEHRYRFYSYGDAMLIV